MRLIRNDHHLKVGAFIEDERGRAGRIEAIVHPNARFPFGMLYILWSGDPAPREVLPPDIDAAFKT